MEKHHPHPAPPPLPHPPTPAAHCISILVCCLGKNFVLNYKGAGRQLLKKSESFSSLAPVLWASCVPGKGSTIRAPPPLRNPLRNWCLGEREVDLCFLFTGFLPGRKEFLLVRVLLGQTTPWSHPQIDTRGLELVPISFPKATQSVTQRTGFLSCGSWPQTQIQLLQLLKTHFHP